MVAKPRPARVECHRIMAKVGVFWKLCDQLEASLAAIRSRPLETLLREALGGAGVDQAEAAS